ncbi:hypothetical protein [Acidisoma sp. S159]|uniref:hypothetical protein n=1 Tax=Acidisoma sp. S159 TaxID=1747225 RepID=UPI00131D05D3|nr:hypothetical protein [Acidisoma sp. S159]
MPVLKQAPEIKFTAKLDKKCDMQHDAYVEKLTKATASVHVQYEDTVIVSSGTYNGVDSIENAITKLRNETFRKLDGVDTSTFYVEDILIEQRDGHNTCSVKYGSLRAFPEALKIRVDNISTIEEAKLSSHLILDAFLVYCREYF